jgi:hypothetical protein
MPRSVFLSFLFILFGIELRAVETVTFRDGDTERTVAGQMVVEAQDGGVMIQSDAGRIWTIYPDDLIARESDDRPFLAIDSETMEQRLRAELPQDFQVFRTPHFVIGYNSSEEYAKRVGGLYEQLYRAFHTYWKNQQWTLPEPEFPLVSLVLKDRADFLRFAEAEIGTMAESVIGYYHLGTNRMITFNVPNFERNSATIIHEATHQLAYNCGLQRRYADNPLWVGEGLATYFETPDRRNPTRWRGIGRVNRVNLARWHAYQPDRPQESLSTLLANDDRYRNSATAAAAYAEGWALTYFLIKTRRKQYVDYLRKLSAGKPARDVTEQARIDMFEAAFETTVAELDRDFLAYMRRVR